MTLDTYASWSDPVTFLTVNNAPDKIVVSGAQTNTSSLTFNGQTKLSDNLTAHNVTFNYALVLNGASIINAGGGGTFTANSTINAGANALLILTDAIALGGNVSGSSSLTLAPTTASTTIGLNATGDFNLSANELGYIPNRVDRAGRGGGVGDAGQEAGLAAR